MFVVSFSKNSVETIIVIIVIFLLHNKKSQYHPSLKYPMDANSVEPPLLMHIQAQIKYLTLTITVFCELQTLLVTTKVGCMKYLATMANTDSGIKWIS